MIVVELFNDDTGGLADSIFSVSGLTLTVYTTDENNKGFYHLLAKAHFSSYPSVNDEIKFEVEIIDSCDSCDLIPTVVTPYQNYDLTLGT